MPNLTEPQSILVKRNWNKTNVCMFCNSLRSLNCMFCKRKKL